MRRFRKRKLELLEMGRNDHRFNLFKLFYAALDLTAFGGLVPKALYELLCAFDLRLLFLVRSLKLFYFKPSLVFVEGIVSTVSFKPTAEKFIDLIHRVVQKAFVMADQEQGTLVALEKLLEPSARLDVQIVRRLI